MSRASGYLLYYSCGLSTSQKEWEGQPGRPIALTFTPRLIFVEMWCVSAMTDALVSDEAFIYMDKGRTAGGMSYWFWYEVLQMLL